jgi:hypothetical protein
MEIIKVGETITQYKNILTNEECDFLFEYTKLNTNNPVEDTSKVPWDLEKSNTLYYIAIKDEKVRNLLKSYKDNMASLISQDLGFDVYPHLTTLVLWKPGQQMPRHVDDGNGYDRYQDLGMRFITSVSYMNDNYKGGYTFVKNDGRNDHFWRTKPEFSFPNNTFVDYISKAEKGTTIAFYADDRNAHGVTRLESGDRVILSTWFTTNPNYKEIDDTIYDNQETTAVQEEENVVNVENTNYQNTTQQNWLKK